MNETDSTRLNSHDFTYSNGPYTYHDTYVGGEQFAGEEAIWYVGKSQYAMNYIGRILSQNMISQILDEVIIQISKSNTDISEYVKRLLEVMEYDVPYTANTIMDLLGLKSKETFRKNYINPAMDLGLVRMTLPDKPNSRNQRYVKQ
jgi:hypothetical protein